MKSSAPLDVSSLKKLDSQSFILIKGARVHNLKNLSVAIPKNNLVVITGLSGSGKSSLAFNTLFAEGQRMYLESLSAYSRQFLARMEKPDVDSIHGICPAIAIEQKVNVRYSRSTVGTITEIYDYLKLLYTHIGKTYSPKSGKEVTKDTPESIITTLQKLDEGTRLLITCPVERTEERTAGDELNLLLRKGFTRVVFDEKMIFIEDILSDKNDNMPSLSLCEVLIDRISIKKDHSDFEARLTDSLETAFFEGTGDCTVHIIGKEKIHYCNRYEVDNLVFAEPSINLFSFNNSYGACKKCDGLGSVMGLDKELIIPDHNLSVYDGAVMPWRSPVMEKWKNNFIHHADPFHFPIHRTYANLTMKQRTLLWEGNAHVKGIYAFFQYVESKSYKIQYRVLRSRYQGKTRCPECQGTRLRQDAEYVKINKVSIIELTLMPLDKMAIFFRDLRLSNHEKKIANRMLTEIRLRIEYIINVGLDYLTLDRLTSTLSGGEFQRIKLATALGSPLVGSMYIIDEPSIGLHPKDTQRMICILKSLRDLGNTVIVVEHEEEVMLAADQIIDIGPEAGIHGGQLVYQGNLTTTTQPNNHFISHTINYLTGKEKTAIPTKKRAWKNCLTLHGVRENNLKNITVNFPLNILTVVTGVSGSGKSTLIKKTLYLALLRRIGFSSSSPGKHDNLTGDIDYLKGVIFIDQNPIGKSSRSNPVSYIKAYDAIRELYSMLPESKIRGYKPAHFSFNVEGGRCDACLGEGDIKIEMQFMADVSLTCEACQGKRFKKDLLEVVYRDKNISDILNMTVEMAIDFFADIKSIRNKLIPLLEVGMGYVKLGQSSNSLSGGEAQRVKLASFLGMGQRNQKNDQGLLFIFDEPTTGLHFHDIGNLLKALNALIDKGNSVIVIEHNTEVIKCADWVIDMGPGGGEKNGGNILYTGTPEMLINEQGSCTGKFLKKKMTEKNKVVLKP